MSLIISLFIAFQSFSKSNKLTKEYNSLVVGQLELQINERISVTRNQVITVSLKISEESELLNNPKIKERFQKAMQGAIEIRNLVEYDSYKKRVHIIENEMKDYSYNKGNNLYINAILSVTE